MWTLLPLLARAEEPLASIPVGPVVPPEVLGALPSQTQDEERWADIDARAARRAQGALVASGIALATTTSGLALLGAVDAGDTDAEPAAIALVTVGAVGSMVAMPTYLSALGRSHRSLKERNVFTGSGAAAGAWTTLGAGLPLMALMLEAPVVYPVWNGAVLALGCAQAAHDDRSRRAAGLGAVRLPWQVTLVPRPDGLSVAGSF
jgi:hypothetical protein